MKSKRLLLLVVSMFSGLVLLPVLSFAQSTSVTNPFQQQSVISHQGMDDYFGLIRANQLTGTVDPADELKARMLTEQKSKLKSGNSIGLEWTAMGPDNVAGRTRALLIDRSNSNLLYAGSVNGGLWKSNNAGSSWSQTQVTGTSDIILNVTCITQTPNGHIFVGTGESFVETGGTGKGGLIGHGIFASTDGQNFTVIPSTKPATENDTLADWVYINRLASTSTGRIFAATNKGLRYSDDEGANWTYAQSNGSPLQSNTMDIKVGANGILVACVGSACYISETGDPAAFVNHSTGGTGKLPLPAQIGRIEFAIAPSNPDVIYASSAKVAGNLDNIYRSTDKGQTWKVVGPGGSVSFNVFNLGSLTSSGKGKYANTIAVYPNDPDQVLLGGYDMWRGKKVDDGYFSWEPISSGTFPSYDPLYLHYSQHAIVFSSTSPNTVYFSNDGGMAVSYDGAQTFVQKIKNYATTQCYSVASSHDDKILLGTQGNGVQYIDKNGNTPLSGIQVSSGATGIETGGYSAISFINPKIMFVTANNGQSTRSIDYGASFASYYSSAMSLITGAYVTPLLLWESFNDESSLDSIKYVVRDTIDAGEAFKVRSPNGNYPFWVTNNTGATLYPIVDTIMIQDIIQSKLFLGANGAVWFTKQGLDFTISPTWYKLALINNTVQTMAYTPDGNTLFVGTQNGYLLRIRHIKSWVSETENDVTMDTLMNFNNRAITSIAVNPVLPDNVIVTLGNYGNTVYVYGSINALAETPTFSNKQGDLPAMPVYASVIEMSSPDRAVIGTEMGIYSTTNFTSANPGWTAETTGMGIIPVYMLEQQSTNWWPIIADADSLVVTNYGVIYAASHGRGAYKCSKFVGINDPIKPGKSAASLNVYPNPATDHVVLSYSVSATSNVSVEIYDFTGRLVEQQNIKAQTPGTHLLNLSVGNYVKGTYFVRMLAGNEQSTAKLIVQ